MAELPEELGIEIEALVHLLGQDAFTMTSDAGSTKLTLSLVPRQLEGEHEAYVAATLVLTVDESYPATAAAVALKDVKGLSDAAETEMLDSLKTQSQNLAGEMVLGHLCELALDLISDANHPIGNCIFCLQHLVENTGKSGHSNLSHFHVAYHVLKLPCYHCFHLPCFSAWYQWRQQELKRIAEEPAAPGVEKPRAEDVTCADGWVAQGLYAIHCPSCRMEVAPSALCHALPELLGRTKVGSGGARIASVEAWEAAHPSPVEVLSSHEMHELREMQKKFGKVLELQRACNGLVQENVAVSLAELEAVAAEKRKQLEEEEAEKRAGEGGEGNVAAAAAAADEGSTRSGRGRRGRGGGHRGGRGYRGRGGRGGVETGGSSGATKQSQGHGSNRSKGGSSNKHQNYPDKQ